MECTVLEGRICTLRSVKMKYCGLKVDIVQYEVQEGQLRLSCWEIFEICLSVGLVKLM